MSSFAVTELCLIHQVPKSVLCGTFRKYLQELNLWIGFNGTRSVVHYDADHNIHCLLSGRKDFIMIERRYQHKVGLGRKVSFGHFLLPDIWQLVAQNSVL